MMFIIPGPGGLEWEASRTWTWDDDWPSLTPNDLGALSIISVQMGTNCAEMMVTQRMPKHAQVISTLSSTLSFEHRVKLWKVKKSTGIRAGAAECGYEAIKEDHHFGILVSPPWHIACWPEDDCEAVNESLRWRCAAVLVVQGYRELNLPLFLLMLITNYMFSFWIQRLGAASGSQYLSRWLFRPRYEQLSWYISLCVVACGWFLTISTGIAAWLLSCWRVRPKTSFPMVPCFGSSLWAPKRYRKNKDLMARPTA